jgi:cell division protein FtsB
LSTEQQKWSAGSQLPFASEVLEEQSYPMPVVLEYSELQFASESKPEPVKASSLPPSIYDQPKEKFIELHTQPAVKEPVRAVQQYVSVEVNENDPLEHSESADDNGEGSESEEKSLLGFLADLLPGTSAPRTWRPVGTVVVMLLILFLGWHVVNGKDGLTVWQQKRAEERHLQQEIDQLQQENAQVKSHIDELNSNKDAIEREAREKLHYARSSEIIYTLPEKPAVANPTK